MLLELSIILNLLTLLSAGALALYLWKSPTNKPTLIEVVLYLRSRDGQERALLQKTTRSHFWPRVGDTLMMPNIEIASEVTKVELREKHIRVWAEELVERGLFQTRLLERCVKGWRPTSPVEEIRAWVDNHLPDNIAKPERARS